MFWNKKQKPVKIDFACELDADKIMEILEKALPSNYEIRVWHAVYRTFYRHRSLTVEIKGEDITLKVEGASFVEILNKVACKLPSAFSVVGDLHGLLKSSPGM